MNKKLYLAILLVIVLLSSVLSINVHNQATEFKNCLKFNTSNFESNEGQALIKLYRINDDLPKKPYRQKAGKIKNKKAVIIFDDLPYGEYAAILVHDQNSDYSIDHSWGLPSEPLGFTNNWKLTMFSGMPTFEKLKFSFSEHSSEQYIKIQN